MSSECVLLFPLLSSTFAAFVFFVQLQHSRRGERGWKANARAWQQTASAFEANAVRFESLMNDYKAIAERPQDDQP